MKLAPHHTIVLSAYYYFSFTYIYIDCEKIDRAFSLALAALLGSDVFNFGELVFTYFSAVFVLVLICFVSI